MTRKEIKELENLDHILLRKILGTPFSTPIESLYLELGLIDIETIIMARRINYLQYLVKRDKSEMLSKFCMAQWNFPATRGEWTEQVKSDLASFDIPEDLQLIEIKSKNSFKNLVKRKAKEFAFGKFMEQKELHSKMNQLSYSRLMMQEYLKCDKLDSWEAKAVFNYRTRMAKYRDNYKGQRGQAPCPLCNLHLDVQNICFQCPSVRENVKLKGKYEKIFGNKISKELAKTVLEISKYREKYLEERQIEF